MVSGFDEERFVAQQFDRLQTISITQQNTESLISKDLVRVKEKDDNMAVITLKCYLRKKDTDNQGKVQFFL